METEGTKIRFMLLAYMPPRKLSTKLVKEIMDGKFSTFTQLLLEEVSFDGEVLGKIAQLKIEDAEFNDRSKYPQFELRRYLKKVQYLESGVTRLQPHQWATGLQRVGLLNILNVPNSDRSTSNASYVRQLLSLVHDGCLWLGTRIPTEEMLIKIITAFPHQGKDHIDGFVGKNKDKEMMKMMKQVWDSEEIMGI